MLPTTNILQRTFRISHGDKEGTCFTVDVDDRQYLVTAKHIVQSIGGPCVVKIFHDRTWKDLHAELVGHGAGSIDITVLAPVSQLSPTHPLHTTPAGLALSQDVFFLGFPYGLANEMGKLNNDFPLPLVKKGIVSAMQFGDVKTLLLDGHNNPGFSGGPVVYQSTTDREGSMTVVGVVSGYLKTSEPVYNASNEATLSYDYNTGIVAAHFIDHATDLIHANPIGFKLDSSERQG